MEEDDEDGEEAEQFDQEGNPVDDEMVEFHDDSVQGFFTHKGKNKLQDPTLSASSADKWMKHSELNHRVFFLPPYLSSQSPSTMWPCTQSTRTLP